jgi:hypothetical protein
MVGKGGRGVKMKTMPPSRADCLEILGVSTSWSPRCMLQGLLYFSQAQYYRQRASLFKEHLSLSLCSSLSVTYIHIDYTFVLFGRYLKFLYLIELEL